MRNVCKFNAFRFVCEILDMDGRPLPSSATIPSLFTTDEAGTTPVDGSSANMTQDPDNDRLWSREVTVTHMANLPTTGIRYLRVNATAQPRVEAVQCVASLPFDRSAA